MALARAGPKEGQMVPRNVADALARWNGERKVTAERTFYIASVGLRNICWPPGRREPYTLRHPREVLKYIEPSGFERNRWPEHWLVVDARVLEDKWSKHQKDTQVVLTKITH